MNSHMGAQCIVAKTQNFCPLACYVLTLQPHIHIDGLVGQSPVLFHFALNYNLNMCPAFLQRTGEAND